VAQGNLAHDYKLYCHQIICMMVPYTRKFLLSILDSP